MSAAKVVQRRRRRRAPVRRPIRHFLEYVGLRLVGFLVRLLPLEAASATMAWFWRLIAPHLERHPRVLAHLALAYPEKSEAERRLIASAMWANIGRVFAESFVIDRIAASERVSHQLSAELAEWKAAPRGIVFVSLHAGNWELVITPALKAGIKAAGVYQKVKNPHVDHYLVDSGENAIRVASSPREATSLSS